MNEIYIKYYAVSSWMSPEMWDDYFRSMEAILNDKLWKLDENDPHRRNADTEAGEGDYVVKFTKKQEVKWIHGKYQKSRITFMLEFYQHSSSTLGDYHYNSLSVSIPMSYAKKNWDKVIEVFRCGNEKLGVFYSCGDIYDVMMSKMAWNLSTMLPSFELLGIFWLTYFGPEYCEYFTREKLHNIAGASDGPAGGITLQLADVPEKLSREDRAAVENALGSESFAKKKSNPDNYKVILVNGKITFPGEKITVVKAKGQYVLTLEQLRGEVE